MVFGRLSVGGNLRRRRCGPASLSAAEVMVPEVIEKLSVGSEKTHWTWYPKNEDSCILVDWMAVKWREVLEFCGSRRCA